MFFVIMLLKLTILYIINKINDYAASHRQQDKFNIFKL